MSSEEITVTLRGSIRKAAKGTPIGELFEREERRTLIAARLNGKLVDLSRPLDQDATIEGVSIDSPAGIDILRHSTAHLMAQAVQSLYPGTQVTIGPATEEGFYYDFARSTPFTSDDLPKIEQRMRELARADEKIERMEMTRDEAVELFARMGEHFKVEILRDLPDDRVSIYRQGDWMDLCRGPHVPSTGWIKAFALLSVAGAYWRGDERNAMLSRVYGTAFPDQASLEEHLELLKLARARDHRRLGRELGLVLFDSRAPGSPFFLPKGAIVVNELIAYIRRLYARYGFKEVITPQIFRNELWRTSGHWELFRENMFLTTDGENAGGELDYALKPMNCPAHAVLYASEKRSYRDLPLRLADFGRLHRAERSGVLHGLTRVRAMTQDDAHIFCTLDQIAQEVDSNLKMVREVYQALGFEQMELKLATMPEEHLGSEQTWRRTEAMLAEAMERNGLSYQTNPGEGAFYGPKIEIYVPDALKRRWQLATIQLDFNMPERFGLEYVSSHGTAEQPVMIHRAILGTIERFLGVFIEHTGGLFPFWLAPEQVRVLSLTDKVESYASELAARLEREGLRVALDARNEKLGFKVRQAELAKVPYIVVAGEREAAAGTISLRRVRGAKAETMTVEELVATLKSEPLPG
jgi:threonyl-tRNA synthetase